MPKATVFANDVLDAEYSNSASGTFVLGSTTYTYPIKVDLLTTLSVAATKGTPFSGGSYAAQSLAGAMTAAASAGSKSNTAALSFAGMPAGTWADVETMDSTGTPKRMNFKGTPSLAKTINAGDTCVIPISSFTGTET